MSPYPCLFPRLPLHDPDRLDFRLGGFERQRKLTHEMVLFPLSFAYFRLLPVWESSHPLDNN